MIRHIWIDADSCPVMVRDYVVKYANKLNIPLTFVANKEIKSNVNLPYRMVISSSEKDSADNYILENAKTDHLVITRDIVFADKLIQNNIKTINDRGTIFDSNNIKELLSQRDFDLQLAEIGLVKHYNEGYNKEKFAKFANCFDKIIHQK